LYSNITRSDEYKQQLLDFIRRKYGIDAISIYPAKRGFYGETWRLEAANGNYFAKLVYASEHMGIYESSFPIIDHMNRHGIDFISKIVKTVRGELSAHYDSAVLGVFDWIDGELIETDDTKIPEYQMLAKVYTVPVEWLTIPREDFSARSADLFFRQCESLPPNAPIHAFFESHRVKIVHRAERLRLFSERCRNDTSCFVITHGDAGGNFIMSGDKYYIIDWDTPILAPPERDAWVMCNRDWARCLFHKSLRENGIGYNLRPERLAYYLYHMFFFYLNAFLDSFTQTGDMQGVEGYMNGWIEESFQYADKMP
jgi:hypothetical protein